MCTGTRIPIIADPRLTHAKCDKAEFNDMGQDCLCCEKYQECNDYERVKNILTAE